MEKCREVTVSSKWAYYLGQAALSTPTPSPQHYKVNPGSILVGPFDLPVSPNNAAPGILREGPAHIGGGRCQLCFRKPVQWAEMPAFTFFPSPDALFTLPPHFLPPPIPFPQSCSGGLGK